MAIGLEHTCSSAGLWNSATYLCASAYSASRRYFGLKVKSFLSKSSASGLAPGKNCSNFFYFVTLIEFKIFHASELSMLSMSSFLGLPVSSSTRSIWFSVLTPGKIDFPMISSPNMHPTLHMSTALVYFVLPRRISGARYQRVATYSVRTGGASSSFYAMERAKPKSASFTWHSLLSKIFEGFKSLWIKSPECMYLRAFKI